MATYHELRQQLDPYAVGEGGEAAAELPPRDALASRAVFPRAEDGRELQEVRSQRPKALLNQSLRRGEYSVDDEGWAALMVRDG